MVRDPLKLLVGGLFVSFFSETKDRILLPLGEEEVEATEALLASMHTKDDEEDIELGVGDNEEAEASSKKSKKKKKKKKGKKPGASGSKGADSTVCLYPGNNIFDIVQGGESGRRAISKVDEVCAGTLVLAEEPYGFIVGSANARKYCAACCAPCASQTRGSKPIEPNPSNGWHPSAYKGGVVPGTTQDTGGVKLVVYCSEKCKAAHAELHALEEPCLAQLRPICLRNHADPDLIRFIVRLACERVLEVRNRKRGPASTAAEHDAAASFENSDSKAGIAKADLRWQQLLALVAHPPTSEEWTVSVRGALTELVPLLPAAVGADCFGIDLVVPDASGESHGDEKISAVIDGLLKLGLRINSNSHGMRDLEGRNSDVAIGLFPTFAMFNHSCAPNCVFAFSPAKRAMEVRTVQNLGSSSGKGGIGTEFCVSYIDLYQPTGVRREELKQTKHFTCACDRCEGLLMGSSPPETAYPGPANDAQRKGIGSGDYFLDGLCCSKCCEGQDAADDPTRALLRTFPPSPETLQRNMTPRQSNSSEQQRQLKEIEREADDALLAELELLSGPSSGKATSARQKKSKSQLKKEAAAAAAATTADQNKKIPEGSTPSPSQHEQLVDRPPIPPTRHYPPGSLHCHRCGLVYSEKDAMAVNRNATLTLGSVGPLLAQRKYGDARKILEELLQQYVATPALASSPPHGSGKLHAGGRGHTARLLLHPMHTVAFNSHAQLVNCCRSSQDHSSAVRNLRQIVRSIDAVYPENYPEAADFLYAYVSSLSSSQNQSMIHNGY